MIYMIERTVNKNSSLYKDVFYEVYKSMQLSSAYVLYYDIDLSKEELQDFNKKFCEHDQEDSDHKISEREIKSSILEEIGFDCKKESLNFPYRAKLKMYGKKTSSKTIATVSVAASNAVELYFTLCIYTLRTDYHFDIHQIMIWYEKLKEFARLYGDGLTDDHVFKYFMQECELECYEE